jgi:hypothetical protein
LFIRVAQYDRSINKSTHKPRQQLHRILPDPKYCNPHDYHVRLYYNLDPFSKPQTSHLSCDAQMAAAITAEGGSPRRRR